MEPQAFYWIGKRVQIGAPQWTLAVISSEKCPDQRKYRRLTREERLKFFQARNQPS